MYGQCTSAPLPVLLSVRDLFVPTHSCRHLFCSDVSLDPLIELKRGVRQLSHLQGGANCLFVEALVFGWVSRD